jgi:hypothetical protein
MGMPRYYWIREIQLQSSIKPDSLSAPPKYIWLIASLALFQNLRRGQPANKGHTKENYEQVIHLSYHRKECRNQLNRTNQIAEGTGSDSFGKPGNTRMSQNLPERLNLLENRSELLLADV